MACWPGLEVRELAKASMTELARQTGGAVALGAFDGDAMTYVEAVHGSSALYLRLPSATAPAWTAPWGAPTSPA